MPSLDQLHYSMVLSIWVIISAFICFASSSTILFCLSTLNQRKLVCKLRFQWKNSKEEAKGGWGPPPFRKIENWTSTKKHEFPTPTQLINYYLRRLLIFSTYCTTPPPPPIPATRATNLPYSLFKIRSHRGGIICLFLAYLPILLPTNGYGRWNFFFKPIAIDSYRVEIICKCCISSVWAKNGQKIFFVNSKICVWHSLINNKNV